MIDFILHACVLLGTFIEAVLALLFAYFIIGIVIIEVHDLFNLKDEQ